MSDHRDWFVLGIKVAAWMVIIGVVLILIATR